MDPNPLQDKYEDRSLEIAVTNMFTELDKEVSRAHIVAPLEFFHVPQDVVSISATPGSQPHFQPPPSTINDGLFLAFVLVSSFQSLFGLCRSCCCNFYIHFVVHSRVWCGV